MITKSAVLFKIKSPLKIINLKIPKLKKNQVLVKILYSGFCSSQYGEIIGIKGKDNYLPHCLGHEACGIVIRKANNIKNLEINDLVVCHWMKNHGKDCEKIEYNNTLNGAKINSGQITTFNTLSIISFNRLTKINKGKYKIKFLPSPSKSLSSSHFVQIWKKPFFLYFDIFKTNPVYGRRVNSLSKRQNGRGCQP